ncbi:MAG: hypothetical protein KAX89_02840, partial [Propionivibrio sp.]|nr:hypothetical protein [Propionivibrio sp.]
MKISTLNPFSLNANQLRPAQVNPAEDISGGALMLNSRGLSRFFVGPATFGGVSCRTNALFFKLPG